MTSPRFFYGNRLELLAEEFARVLETPLPSPFDQEIILVQSKGMERWLSMQMATHLGICANCRFPFPNAFVNEIFQLVIPDLPATSLFDPQFCTWRIMQVLPSYLTQPGFEHLRHYLQDSTQSLKQLQLARRIAETFDQYLIYRPELIAAWEAGKEDHWQAALWRDLALGHEQEHRAALRDKLLKKLDGANPGEYTIPARLSVFGISYLPPFHMLILERLARLTEVNLFLLNPCEEYWGDIPSNRDIRRVVSAQKHQQRSPEELHLHSGNSLLASTGALGRDFFDLLVSLDCEEHKLFEEDNQNTLLAKIQGDILHLRNGAELPSAERTIPGNDQSIAIHSCHNAMREVEVLYDQLLAMFKPDAGLLPKDIIVMTPDIESYAPFFQAVFGAPDDDSKSIPYSIADRSLLKESHVLDAFVSILDLFGERLTAPQVMAILESPPVQERFGLAESDLDLIIKWVREVQIRWGIDEMNRQKWSSPAFRENTWMAGIDRLLLGYALPGGDEKLFCGVLPYDNIEGNETSVLESFAGLLTDLFALLESFETPKTLSEWADLFSTLVANFMAVDDDSEVEAQRLRQVFSDLKRIQEVSGFEAPVQMELIRWYLGKQLQQEGFGRGFMTGGVTFCSMLPMRSIPFKVVCLIGMNENAFPRQSKPLEFDLMAKAPRPGDRSVRNEDRYLFLEAVLSAREKLYISFTGQSSRDNSIMPPSVLVSELSDYIHKNYLPPDGKSDDWFFTRHRLQPFNPAYFQEGPVFFSYSENHRVEAERMLAEKRDPPPFISERLSPPEEAYRALSVMDLCRFFANPAKYLLNKRFGIYLGEDDSVLEETECFDLDSLERYSLNQTLVESALADGNPDDLYPMIRASGQIPHGTPGEYIFKELSRGVELFAQETRPYLRGERLEPLEVDLQLGGFNLTGSIQPIYPERLLRYRYAKMKAKDLLSAWVMHLVLNSINEPGYPSETMVIGLDGTDWAASRYLPPDNSREILEQLLALYWDGLQKPLQFFPETSLEYAKLVVEKQKPRDEAVGKVESTWFGGDYRRGESKDEHLQHCFKTGSPLDADFQTISEQVYAPLLMNRRDM